MKRTFLLCLAVTCCICHGTLSAQQSLSPAQMQEDLNQFFDVTKHAYAYVEEKHQQHGLDLDQARNDALKRLQGIHSNTEFRNLLKESIARLRDGHCEIYADHLIAPKGRFWPLLLREVKEGVLVTGFAGSLVDSGLQIGDQIVAVNDQPMELLLSESVRIVSASTDGARRRIALQRMSVTSDEHVKVTVRHKDGTEKTLTLKTGPYLKLPAEPNLADLPAENFVSAGLLNDNVAYMRIPTFALDTQKRRDARTDAELDACAKVTRDKIDAAFAYVAKTKALVLDLRGNSGGWDNLGAYVLSHFISDDFCYYSLQTRSSPELRNIDHSATLPKNGEWGLKWDWRPRKTTFSFFKGQPYRGTLVVLINEDVFSAADCLAAALADLYPNVRFVGRQTHGGAGGPRILAKLKHSGADLQLCTMRVWSPNGRLIEGHGTPPNIPVQWTRDDILQSRDPDLDTAFKLLTR